MKKGLDIISHEAYERLADLLEEYVEDYGSEEIMKFIKLYKKSSSIERETVNGIIKRSYEFVELSTSDYICACLAINPNYVLTGRGQVYKENQKVWYKH